MRPCFFCSSFANALILSQSIMAQTLTDLVKGDGVTNSRTFAVEGEALIVPRRRVALAMELADLHAAALRSAAWY